MGVLIPFLFDSRRTIGVWVGIDDRSWLFGGAGVHRFTVGMQVDGRNTLPAGTPLSLGGEVWLVTTGAREYLGRWHTEKPLALYTEPFSTNLVLELRDDQLALIEQRRGKADGGVRFEFDIDAALTGGLPKDEPPPPPPRWRRRRVPKVETGSWPVSRRGHTITFTPGQWAELLAGVTAHASLVVVMPVPALDPAAHAVSALLRDAVKLIEDCQPAKAVIDARRAIEMMDPVFGSLSATNKDMKAIADIQPGDRTQDQRFALLRHALFSLASPPAHGDLKAQQFVWDREAAVAVLAGVAALGAVRLNAQPEVTQP